ncbi:MAG: plasmid pRiA4b ORF-3 family protein [Bacteroidales bacterium]|nr:plasmid pRiA4b ORF-3 family protein [Bacteroidales bacterium]
MYYYKFKVFYDEVEDFVRDVDVLANSNFEDFHLFLYQCLGLQGNEFAAFSICYQKWNKQKEITLMDTSEDEEMAEAPEYDDEDSFSTKSQLPRFVMKDSILKDFITDPHQHILYEYDFIDPKTFYIEFQKVAQTEKPDEFPRCTFQKGTLPTRINPKNMPQPDVDEASLLLDEMEDEDDDFNDGFNDGYNEEDYSDLNEFSDF